MNIISGLLQKKWLWTAGQRIGAPFLSGRRQIHRHYRGRLAWKFGGACVSVLETALVVGALAAATPPDNILKRISVCNLPLVGVQHGGRY